MFIFLLGSIFSFCSLEQSFANLRLYLFIILKKKRHGHAHAFMSRILINKHTPKCTLKQTCRSEMRMHRSRFNNSCCFSGYMHLPTETQWNFYVVFSQPLLAPVPTVTELEGIRSSWWLIYKVNKQHPVLALFWTKTINLYAHPPFICVLYNCLCALLLF